MTSTEEQLRGLAEHLHAQRDQILQAWQESVAGDPRLTTAGKIPHAQFTDHIPQVLQAYEHRLNAREPVEKHQARIEQRAKAAEHGLMRWYQGYDQSETMREWGHLHLAVLRELERYECERPGLGQSVMPTARATLVRLCAEGVCESTARYTRMKETEAAGRVRDLEQALQQLLAVERQRAEVWREAAHDLRGAASVITNASAILSSESVEHATRARFSDVLARSVASMRELLNDLIHLGRLEAGQEQRNVVAFDAAKMLKELCESMRVLTRARNLFLKDMGPDSLAVEGDPVKVRRIVQNLVLNAVRVTRSGGVQVSWQARELTEHGQWTICVQDTGPGIAAEHVAPLERVLKQATLQNREQQLLAQLEGDRSASVEAAPTLASASADAQESGGEGIGLSIVKRLCELLDASIELESAPGRGTTFRITFPRHYFLSGSADA